MKTNRFVTRRQFVGIAAAVMGSAVLVGCSNTQTGSSEEETASESETQTSGSVEEATPSEVEAQKAVVVFFSQTGNTAAIAAHIADHLDVESIELKAAVPYESSDLGYADSNSRATEEQNAPETRPELAEIPDLSVYETVFLGYPIWFGKAPRLICTLVEGCDLSGKTIVPFCTSDSSDIAGSVEELVGLTSADVMWLEGRRFEPGTDDQTVSQWVDSLPV